MTALFRALVRDEHSLQGSAWFQTVFAALRDLEPGHKGEMDMFQPRRRLAAGITATALLSLLFTSGCSSSSSAGSTTGPQPTAVLGAAGSTFIAPLMTKWVDAYRETHPTVVINYRPIGSGGGIAELKKGYLNFGASDAPLNDDQVKDMAPVIQVPDSAGPVCIVYNLPNVSAPLRLGSKTLSDIYLGNIISWQEPAIARDNPAVAFPKGAVIVVHRSDGSGTTHIFTSYLSKVSHVWSEKSGHGISVTWPVGIGAEGSKGVLAIVKQTPGTIGYAELSYAKQAGVAYASIQNAAGHFVQPSPASAAAAVAAFSDELAKDIRTPVVDPPSTAAEAYPITGLTYFLIPKDGKDEEQQAAIKDFVNFALTTGQDSSEELSYTKLPDAVQKQGQALLSQLTANGQPLK
jgi:phosphate transport system substrate-binding protein